MPTPNDPNFFPELRFSALQTFVIELVTQLEEMEVPPPHKVALYHTPDDPERKYLLEFVVPEMEQYPHIKDQIGCFHRNMLSSYYT